MTSPLLERIEQRLVVVGLSATEASKLAGLNRDAIRNMRRAAQEEGRADGSRGVRARTIAALAKVLQTTPGWLMSGVGEPPGEASGGQGYGAAGASSLPFIEWDDAGQYTATDKPVDGAMLLGEHAWPRGTFVTRVVDEAMNRLAPAGAYIVVDRTERMVSTGLCYLGVLDDQVVFRRWLPNPERAEPYSTDTSYQTEFMRPGRRWDIIGRVRRIFLDV
jgi:hypothetical protein